jgi:tetratricopeptide (TPR) repeat protein
VAAQQGDYQLARAFLQENLEALKELQEEGNPATKLKRCHALFLLGYLAINEKGDYARATTLWEESLALAREVGDTVRVGHCLSNLGFSTLMQGDYERAKALCEEALALAHESGSAGEEFALGASINMGLTALSLGEHERAMASFEVALLISQDMGRKQEVIESLEGMASLAGAIGEAIRAARLWGAAETAREVTSSAMSAGERALHEPHLAAARSRLGEVAREEALAEGRAMTLEEAAQYALPRVEEPAVPQAPVP